MSKEQQKKRHLVRAESGTELILTHNEYQNGVRRKQISKVGLIRADSAKRPILKVLYFSKGALTIPEILDAIDKSITITEDEAALIKTRQQVWSAVSRLINDGLIESIPMDEPTRRARNKYRILDLGKEWVAANV